MLFQMIWYFILLSVLVKGNEVERLYKQNQIRVQARVKGKLADFSFATERIEARPKEAKIIKRGIVLVDEDFDVPSAIYAHENNSGTGVSSNVDLFVKNEGSGDDELDVKEVTNTTKEMTFTHISSTEQSTSMLPTKEVKLTTIEDTVSSTVTKDIMSSTDFEGSGDDTVMTTNEQVVTEMTTSQITELVYEEIPFICLNSTCSQDDLLVSLSNDKNLMAEGTNISLLCQSNNSTHNMLYWYKSNGTVYFLQAFGARKELLFNIPNSKSVHSGLYKCVKWIDKETCCNLELNLSVYEIPLYKYYIIILSLIVAACLIICIILSVRQTITLKIYTKQFVEKHGKAKPFL